MERCSCIVLSVMPFRETSLIATLLSREHGRVGGIAKGIRRIKKSALPLERGQVIDLVLYYRPHRELNTMSQISIVDYFGGVRSDLAKLAARDCALEIMLKTLSATEPHPELYDLARSFLSRLESLSEAAQSQPLLWTFLTHWSALLGFKIALGACLRCGSDRIVSEGGRLFPEQGGVVCGRCAPADKTSRSFIPGPALEYLLGRCETFTQSLSEQESVRITGILTDFIRYHFNIRAAFKSVTFLEELCAAESRIRTDG